MAYFIYGQTEIAYLTQRDPQLGSVIDKIGIIKREVIPDLFTALIKSIVAQQISNKAAETVWRKLCEKRLVINPYSIVNTELADMQRCGLSLRKAGYIQNIAHKTVSGELDFVALNQLSNEQFIKTLSSLSGVGIWTAEMLLIFSLDRPDVVSWGDLAIRRGMMNLYGLPKLTKAQFAQFRNNYSPFGSVASLYLWALPDFPKS
jgi:3-methyladenine DNA glycosylase/8-oxoguanine DNA glycosylase